MHPNPKQSDAVHAQIATNLAHWEEVTRIHLAAEDQAVRLQMSRTTLQPIEREEFAPLVRGRSLLHLQCHTGEDTLSWAREGARTVTGVDFSPRAIAAARRLSDALGIPAEFVACEVCDAASTLGRTFDVVCCSWGALCWLPDIDRWAANVGRLVAPGGAFYLAEFHPLAWALADEATPEVIALGYPYLPHTRPNTFESEFDYLDPSQRTPRHHTWNHGLGPIVTALVREGLCIEFLHEFPHCPTALVPVLQRRADGTCGIPGTEAYPLSYSLLARQPQNAPV